MNSLKRRTLASFAILFLGAAMFIGGWKILHAQPQDGDTPRPFRQVMELNGKIWKKIFKVSRTDRAKAPPPGKLPRVNGDIGMTKPVDPATWRLKVDTDEENPDSRRLSISMKKILELPRTDTTSEFRCIEGWSEDMSFAGVKFTDFMKAFNIEGKKYVGLETVDGEYYVSIDIESMQHEQTLLAYEMNGMPLRFENGAPLRLVIPVKYGIKNLKQIGRIFFSDTRPPDYWAEQGYDWYAGL